METRKVTVSFVLKVDGQVRFRDITLDWIETDDVRTIANDIEEAILNIE